MKSEQAFPLYRSEKSGTIQQEVEHQRGVLMGTRHTLSLLGEQVKLALRERSERDGKHYRASRLSRDAGTTKQYLSECMHGRIPSRFVLEKWCDTMECSPTRRRDLFAARYRMEYIQVAREQRNSGHTPPILNATHFVGLVSGGTWMVTDVTMGDRDTWLLTLGDSEGKGHRGSLTITWHEEEPPT